MSLFNNPINAPFPPRAFQQEGFNTLTSHTEDYLVVASPGAGKTYLMLMLAKYYIENKKKVLISVNMLSVLNQMIEHATRWGFDIGVVQGNHELTNPLARLQLASNLTLIKRDLVDYDLIMVDEVHIIPKKLHDLLCVTDTRVLGFSATPFSKGLFKIFGNNVLNLSTSQELTKLGILVPLRIVSGTKIDQAKLSKDSYGEYSAESIENATTEILGDTIQLWKDHAQDRQTLIFASRISHAQAVSDEFNAHGITSAVYCADTLPADRETLIAAFKACRVRVIVSVQAISVGFDAPIASVMIDLRPLRKSLSTLIQSIGRIMRSAPNKHEALLLDCTGNIVRMANDYVDLFQNGVTDLEHANKKDKEPKDKEPPKEAKEPTPCPECNSMLWLKKTCLACGYTIPPEPVKIEHITQGVEFKEFDIFAAKRGETNGEVWGNVCLYAFNKFPNDKKLAEKRAKFYYKNITGEWPAWGQKFKPTKQSNPEIINKIIQQNIAYAKAQQR